MFRLIDNYTEKHRGNTELHGDVLKDLFLEVAFTCYDFSIPYRDWMR